MYWRTSASSIQKAKPKLTRQKCHWRLRYSVLKFSERGPLRRTTMHSSKLSLSARHFSRCHSGCKVFAIFSVVFSMDKARSGIGKKELLVSCLLPSLLLAGVTHAADIVWTNTAGGNFATAVNWNPNQVPASGDTAWITNDGTYTVTFNTSATIGSLMLGGSSGTQTFNHSSGTLTLSGSSVGSDHAIYNLSGGGLTGNGSFALTGILNWTAGIVGSSGATLALSANGGDRKSTRLKSSHIPLS